MINPLHQIAHDWAVRCFGARHVASPGIRALRLAEEAIELAQAAGVTEVEIGLLTKNVYQRPPGTMFQELGGVFMTANVLAVSQGIDPQDAYTTELRRVLGKPPEHFAQRNREKIAGDV